MSKHTPTPPPWRAVHHEKESAILSDDWGPIATTQGDCATIKEKRANAEFIVHCVNTHDALVKALEWAIKKVHCPEGGYHENESCFFCSELEDAKAALAAAKAK